MTFDGKPFPNASVAIVYAGCRLGRITKVKSSKPLGTVVGQTPRPGTRLTPGSKVNLKISRGH